MNWRVMGWACLEDWVRDRAGAKCTQAGVEGTDVIIVRQLIENNSRITHLEDITRIQHWAFVSVYFVDTGLFIIY